MSKENIRDFISEWQETVEMVYLLTEEVLKFSHLIDIEIEKLKNKSEREFLGEQEFLNELQPWFRINIRSSITIIETICYKLKQNTILICEQRNKTLTPSELEKLMEKKRDRDGKLQNYYPKTQENIIFTLKKIYYAFDRSFEIKDHDGWRKLCESIEKRNKLTHPKKKDDLKATAQQYNDASVGFAWFTSRIKDLVNKH